MAASKEIEAMYQRLRVADLNCDEAQDEDLGHVAKSPFVGRHLEWSQLNEAWNTARQGGAHLLLVTGDPGIGKSRLALELGRHYQTDFHVESRCSIGKKSEIMHASFKRDRDSRHVVQ